MNMIRQRQQKFSIEIRREQREEFIKKQRAQNTLFLELGFGENMELLERAFIDAESKCYEELVQLVQQNQHDRVYGDVIDFVLHLRIVQNWNTIPENYDSEGVVDQVIKLFLYKCPRLDAICLQYLVVISFLGHEPKIFRTFESINKLLEENTHFQIWNLIMKFLGNMAADCRECRDYIFSYGILYQVQTTVEKPELTFEEIESLFTLIDNIVTTEPYPTNLQNICQRLTETILLKIKDLQQLNNFSSLYCYILQKSQCSGNRNVIEHLLQTQLKIGNYNDSQQVQNLTKLLLNFTSHYICDDEIFKQMVDFVFIIMNEQNQIQNYQRQVKSGLQILINLITKNSTQFIDHLISDPKLINLEFKTSEYFALMALISQQTTPEELLQYDLINRLVPYLAMEYQELEYNFIDNIFIIILENLRKIPMWIQLFINIGGEDLMVELQQIEDRDIYDSTCIILDLIQS